MGDDVLIERIRFYVALLAGAVMTAVNIYLGENLVAVCVRLIGVLILFYILGGIVEWYVRRKILKAVIDEVYTFSLDDDETLEAEPNLRDDEPVDPAFADFDLPTTELSDDDAS